jgi:tetratricopeptide (TPR) repeat protein
MAHEPWDFAAVCFPALDRICSDFIEFHPPRMPGISQKLFEFYHDVVSSAYRFLDLMLSRLLQFTTAEDVVMIVSDHGYFTGDSRPASRPEDEGHSLAWQRPRGLLTMKGPGIRRDELVFGGNVLQITPTILSLFGLPVGEDMEGGVLREAFVEAPVASRIATWDEETGEKSDPPPKFDPRESQRSASRSGETCQHESASDSARAVAAVKRQNTWNLALAYLDAEQPAAALPLLESVYASRPERTDYAETLARCQMRLGRLNEAEETLQAILDVAGDGALAQLLLGNLACDRGDFEGSLNHLLTAERRNPRLPGLHNQVGLALSKLGQWKDAERSFRRALELTPDDPWSHLGLAHALLRTGRYSDAAASALDAIGRRYHLPLAHITLGLALCGLRDWPRAIVALENAARLAPTLASPHRILARLYRRMAGKRDDAVAPWQTATENAARHHKQASPEEGTRTEKPRRGENEIASESEAGSMHMPESLNPQNL